MTRMSKRKMRGTLTTMGISLLTARKQTQGRVGLPLEHCMAYSQRMRTHRTRGIVPQPC
jgi:hypothetical protein